MGRERGWQGGVQPAGQGQMSEQEQHLQQMIARVEAVHRQYRAMAHHMYLLLAIMYLSGFLLGVVIGKAWWAVQ